MSQTRRLAAILAADVAGYSRLMGADEEGMLERLKALRRELVDPKIAEHHGRMAFKIEESSSWSSIRRISIGSPKDVTRMGGDGPERREGDGSVTDFETAKSRRGCPGVPATRSAGANVAVRRAARVR
jgi:class 3 adenylate cyclase